MFSKKLMLCSCGHSSSCFSLVLLLALLLVLSAALVFARAGTCVLATAVLVPLRTRKPHAGSNARTPCDHKYRFQFFSIQGLQRLDGLLYALLSQLQVHSSPCNR